METIPAIEGITPTHLWIFVYVAIAICGIIILIDKVADVFRRRKQRKDLAKPELADEIAGKVMAKLRPDLDEIDRKLKSDNTRLDGHDRDIKDLYGRTEQDRNGIRALVVGVLALLNHELHNGNTGELDDAQKELNKYLINK